LPDCDTEGPDVALLAPRCRPCRTCRIHQ
jgi:hypothetical protein